MINQNIKKRLLIIDRDGTILDEPPATKQVDDLNLFKFIPGVITALRQLNDLGVFQFVLATNQDGLGTPSFPEATFWPCQNLMLKTLKGEGVVFDSILIDRSFEAEGLPTRKPGTGMFAEFIGNQRYDLSKSYVIGDRETDLRLAINLGANGIYLSPERSPLATLSTPDWEQIVKFLKNTVRAAKIERKTRETEIAIYIDLDGQAELTTNCDIPFFKHMLQQLAFYGKILIDLDIAQRDFSSHHVIEDTGIVLGDCLARALADRIGLYRTANFIFPFDQNVKAEVVLDISGRGELSWEGSYKYETIEGMPSQMVRHFFASLCSHAGITARIRIEGEDDHHKAECVFKAFGRALREALSIDPRTAGVPSTKGVL